MICDSGFALTPVVDPVADGTSDALFAALCASDGRVLDSPPLLRTPQKGEILREEYVEDIVKMMNETYETDKKSGGRMLKLVVLRDGFCSDVELKRFQNAVQDINIDRRKAGAQIMDLEVVSVLKSGAERVVWSAGEQPRSGFCVYLSDVLAVLATVGAGEYDELKGTSRPLQIVLRYSSVVDRAVDEGAPRSEQQLKALKRLARAVFLQSQIPAGATCARVRVRQRGAEEQSAQRPAASTRTTSLPLPIHLAHLVGEALTAGCRHVASALQAL